MRGRIDLRVCLLRLRIDGLMYRLRAMARSPAALPIAFVCGILVERLHMPDISYAHGFLAGQVKAMGILSILTGSPVR